MLYNLNDLYKFVDAVVAVAALILPFVGLIHAIKSPKRGSVLIYLLWMPIVWIMVVGVYAAKSQQWCQGNMECRADKDRLVYEETQSKKVKEEASRKYVAGLYIGMSEYEVRSAWGYPIYVNRSSDKYSDSALWTYTNKSVYFSNGKVSSVMTQ